MELTRREFMESLFGAAFASSCTSGELRTNASIPGTLLGQDAAAGHLLRGDLRERISHAASLAAREVGVAIVGGGPSGLSAAYELARAGYDDYTVLELEGAVGGTSHSGRSDVTPYPWGAHYLPVPRAANSDLIALLRELGVVRGVDDRGALMVTEPHLVRAPDERLFYRGYWYAGLYLEAGASARDREERSRFEAIVGSWVRYRDARGRPAFTLPLSGASDAPEVRALDSISAERWLARERFSSSRLRWMLDYACRDDYGLTLSEASAWALLFYFAARSEGGPEGSEFITWPEGNGALVRHLERRAGPRIETRTLVFDLAQDAEGVQIVGWDLARDRPVHLHAERAIVATPRFVSTRIVRELRERGEPSFPYASWLVANLHLRDRPESYGTPLAWDNVLYESPSLGYVCATHQRGSDYGPTVLTYYLPLVDTDPRRARERLFAGSYEQYRDAVLLDLTRAHRDLARHVERIDVFRWGHAMVRPDAGFVFSAARVQAAKALGRIHFAHTDLSAVALFEESFAHGLRAGREVLAVFERLP